jgi:hypothetical protein
MTQNAHDTRQIDRRRCSMGRFGFLLLGLIALGLAGAGETSAQPSRTTTNAWHGTASWCEQVGVMQGNKEVARLRLGEFYVWRDLARTNIGMRCIAPAAMPRSGPEWAVGCEASSLAIAVFDLKLEVDGSKTNVLRVMCIE